MKQYEIIASKEVVASFSIDYASFEMKFKLSGSMMVEWIVDQHPELVNVPWRIDFHNGKATVEFYSVGNLVIEER